MTTVKFPVACAPELAINGGQTAAQEPVQFDTFAPSALNS
jgi:hypothetical protein